MIFLYAFASIAWAASFYDALNASWALALFVMLAAYQPDMRTVMIGAAIGLVPSAVIMLLQVFGSHMVMQVSSPPAGLFLNKNFAAEAGLLVLIGCIYYRQWALAPIAALVAFLPMSRGVMVAGAVVIVFASWPYLTHLGKALLLTPLVGAMAYCLWVLDPTTMERFNIWQNTISAWSWFGHGIGSFRTVYPFYAQLGDTLASRPEHAHNEYLEVLFELGIFGSAILFGTIAAAWLCAQGLARLLLVALLAQSFFSFPLHNPATLFLAAVVAGNLGIDWLCIRHLLGLGRDSVCSGDEASKPREAGHRSTTISTKPIHSPWPSRPVLVHSKLPDNDTDEKLRRIRPAL